MGVLKLPNFAPDKSPRGIKFDEEELDALLGLIRPEDEVTYPNPYNGEIKLVLDLVQDNTYNFKIVNQLGQVLISDVHTAQKEGKRTLHFNFSELENGWYFLRVESSQGAFDSYRIFKAN